MKQPDNRLTFQKLEVFCAVVEEGGVGKAADALYLTQPVVSAHLRSLEARMDAQLLERQGRGVALTEAGSRVYRWASEVLRSGQGIWQELEDLREGVGGSAAIGAAMSIGNYLLPDLLADFASEFPDAFIRVENATVETTLQNLLEGPLDFCFIGSYRTLDANLFEATLVGQPGYVLIASAQDEEIPDTLDVAALADLPFIAPPSGTRVRESQDFALSSIGLADRNVIMELGSAESIKAVVAKGVGVALSWKASVLQELDSGVLREVRVGGGLRHDNLYLVQLRQGELSPFQKRLRGFLLEGIAALLEKII